jgi:hypothetical protein
MKHIKLHIDDFIFNELEQGIIVKKMSGSFYGAEDEFLFLIVKSIKDGKEEITIIPKKKRKGGD